MMARLAVGDGQAVELGGVDQRRRSRCRGTGGWRTRRCRRRPGRRACLTLGIGRRHHLDDGQAELRRELEVAVVVPRHGHDGAGAVLHQHVVGDPDRDLLARGRIDRVPAGEDAGLLALAHLAGDQVLRRGGLAVRVHRAPLVGRDQAVHQRVLGREHHEGGAEDGVGPGGEDADRLAGRCAGAGERELELRPLRAADPVALRGGGRVGPVHLRLVVQVGQQPRRRTR